MSDHPELEQLSAWIDDELTAAERAHLDAHVPSCAECSRTAEALRATIDDLGATPAEPMTPSEIAALDGAILEARDRHERYARSKVRRLAWAGGGVAAGLIALVAFLSVAGRSPSKSTSAESAAGNVPVSTAGDYTQASARAALLALASPAGAGGTGELRTNDGSVPAAQAPSGANEYAVVSGQLDSDAEAGVARCDAEIRSKSPGGLRARRFESARFEHAPALLLFYEAPASRPTRIELWVVRPSDCYTLFFAQSKLR